MYFFGHKGRQVLDLRNDFIITFDKKLVTAKQHTSAPDRVSNATYILMHETSRLRASWRVLKFIWSKNLIKLKVKAAESDSRD